MARLFSLLLFREGIIMQKEKLMIKPSSDYNTWHTVFAYVVFGLAVLGVWKLIDLISMV